MVWGKRKDFQLLHIVLLLVLPSCLLDGRWSVGSFLRIHPLSLSPVGHSLDRRLPIPVLTWLLLPPLSLLRKEMNEASGMKAYILMNPLVSSLYFPLLFTSHLSVLLSGMWEGFMLPRLAREIKWGRESPYLHSISFSLIISFSSFLIYHSLFSVLSVPYLVSETHL